MCVARRNLFSSEGQKIRDQFDSHKNETNVAVTLPTLIPSFMPPPSTKACECKAVNRKRGLFRGRVILCGVRGCRLM